MTTTTVFPGRYIQGYRAINRLGPEIARLGSSGFLICGQTVFNKLLSQFRGEIEQKVRLESAKFGGECCDDEIEKLRQMVYLSGSEVIIGMGGGKVMDTCLCCLMLEVYYRYLPSFKKIEDAPEDVAVAPKKDKTDDVSIKIK